MELAGSALKIQNKAHPTQELQNTVHKSVPSKRPGAANAGDAAPLCAEKIA
jgi:hypothetical protein